MDRSCRRVRHDYGVVVVSALGEAVVVVEVGVVVVDDGVVDAGVVVVVAGDVVVDAGVVVVVDPEGVDEVGVESVDETGCRARFVVLEEVVNNPLSCSCVSISC